jgi:hypothetical protein
VEGGGICVCERGQTLTGNRCVPPRCPLARALNRAGHCVKVKKKCKCQSLFVHAGPIFYGHEAPVAGTVQLGFDLQWYMTCTAGKGQCHGSFTVEPPPGHGAVVKVATLTRKGPGKFKPNAAVQCSGPCGALSSGRVRFRIQANATLDVSHISGQSLVFTVKRNCGGPLPDEKITYVFTSSGGLDLRHSDLGPVFK